MRVALFLSVLMLPLCVSAMQPMEDADLARVSGGEGVIFDISLLNNVDVARQPIGCDVAGDGTPNPCRFGLEFADRPGVWLMLKEFYGTLRLQDMRIDIGFLPDTYTGYEGDRSQFRGDDGTCLIDGCDPRDTPALLITYPENKGVGEYEDMRTFFNIGRAALEYDDLVSGTPGYQRDVATGSFLGYRISDSSGANAEAQVRFRGTGYVYGF